MIAPDDLIGLKELADTYDWRAVELTQYNDYAQAIQLLQLAAMLRDYVKRNG